MEIDRGVSEDIAAGYEAGYNGMCVCGRVGPLYRRWKEVLCKVCVVERIEQDYKKWMERTGEEEEHHTIGRGDLVSCLM